MKTAEEIYDQVTKNLKAYENGDLLGGDPYSPIDKYASQREKPPEEEDMYSLLDSGELYSNAQHMDEKEFAQWIFDETHTPPKKQV